MSASAWVLPLHDGSRVAVGESELVHLLDAEPALFPIPFGERPIADLLLWEGNPTPVADLVRDRGAQTRGRLIAIVAFDPSGAGAAEHGAIRITAAPRRTQVEDVDAAPAAEVPEGLVRYAHAAFRDGAGVVPVLDLHAVFGPPA